MYQPYWYLLDVRVAGGRCGWLYPATQASHLGAGRARRDPSALPPAASYKTRMAVAEDAPHLRRLAALEHAVLVDVRVDEGPHAAVLQALDHRVGRHLRRLLPAGRRDVAAARVDRHDHALAKRAEHVVEEVDVVVGRRAEDHALGAGAQRVAHRRQGAQPAAVLHRHRQLVRDALQMLERLRRPRPRPVEVDDVQEPGARFHPAARRLQRRVAVDGLLVEVALDEAHRLALGDVDRRIEDHARTEAQIRAKFANSRSPAPEDFSGWNWAP